MVCISKICLFLINFLKNMIEVRLGTNWYVLRIILLELSRQNFLSPVTVPPKITVRELHCGLLIILISSRFAWKPRSYLLSVEFLSSFLFFCENFTSHVEVPHRWPQRILSKKDIISISLVMAFSNKVQYHIKSRSVKTHTEFAISQK